MIFSLIPVGHSNLSELPIRQVQLSYFVAKFGQENCVRPELGHFLRKHARPKTGVEEARYEKSVISSFLVPTNMSLTSLLRSKFFMRWAAHSAPILAFHSPNFFSVIFEEDFSKDDGQLDCSPIVLNYPQRDVGKAER